MGLRDLIINSLNILADNNGFIKLSKNPIFHSRVKYLNIKYHWQRQEIKWKTITIIYISLKLNGADDFIKSINPGPFYIFKSLIQILKVSGLNEYTDSDDNSGSMNLNS